MTTDVVSIADESMSTWFAITLSPIVSRVQTGLNWSHPFPLNDQRRANELRKICKPRNVDRTVQYNVLLLLASQMDPKHFDQGKFSNSHRCRVDGLGALLEFPG